MQRVKFKLPKLSTRKVWVGGYFNHYNAIVIFHMKPFPANGPHNHIEGEWYDLIDNQNRIAGCLSLEEFVDWFPGVDLTPLINERGYVKSLEPTTLIEMKLTACWDKKENILLSYDFHMDGY